MNHLLKCLMNEKLPVLVIGKILLIKHTKFKKGQKSYKLLNKEKYALRWLLEGLFMVEIHHRMVRRLKLAQLGHV